MQSTRHGSWKIAHAPENESYFREVCAGSQSPWIKPRLQRQAFSHLTHGMCALSLSFLICETGVLIVPRRTLTGRVR